MRRSLAKYIALITLFSWHAPSLAADEGGITWLPEVNINKKYIDFKAPNGSVNISTSVLTGEFGISAAYKRMFASIKFDESLNTASSVDSNGLILDANRQDITATVGYSFSDVSIFMGYKDGLSEINSYSIPNATYSLLNFRDSGAFIGAGYAYNTNKSGTFIGNLAYASMKGEVDKGGSASNPFSANGDTTGFSLGLSWRYPLSESRVMMILGVKAQRYDFKSSVIDYNQDFNILQIGLVTDLE